MNFLRNSCEIHWKVLGSSFEFLKKFIWNGLESLKQKMLAGSNNEEAPTFSQYGNLNYEAGGQDYVQEYVRTGKVPPRAQNQYEDEGIEFVAEKPEQYGGQDNEVGAGAVSTKELFQDQLVDKTKYMPYPMLIPMPMPVYVPQPN